MDTKEGTIKISHSDRFKRVRDMVGLRWQIHNLGLYTRGMFPNNGYFNISYVGAIPPEVKELLDCLEKDGAHIKYLNSIVTD